MQTAISVVYTFAMALLFNVKIKGEVKPIVFEADRYEIVKDSDGSHKQLILSLGDNCVGMFNNDAIDGWWRTDTTR
jgi:hypothetical protein